MASFVLDNAPKVIPRGENRRGSLGLGSAALIDSARWYTRVRFIAAAIFAAAGLLFVLPIGFAARLGVLSVGTPMWILAGILSVGNLPFWIAARRIADDAPHSTVRALLWGEIVLDLVAVTYLVHVIGSVDTFIAFVYLLHITLACIALAPNESLRVALLSAILYLATVALETTGIWPHHSIVGLRLDPVRDNHFLTALFALSAVFLWFVIWYFISTLSQTLRAREVELHEVNRRLLAADEEKNRIMVQTTHDLKSPFFGIESNIELLKENAGDLLPASAYRNVERVLSQSKILRARIDSILLYNTLRARGRDEPQPSEMVTLAALIEEIVEDVRPRAEDRGVGIIVDVPGITVRCDRAQARVLFANLLSNAVAYSHEGGTVDIEARSDPDRTIVVVRDKGIGIPAEALPHIFDEYYRTQEAVRVNRISTGLGLAIVKEIALRQSLTIRVDSGVGRGTTFEVSIPRLLAEPPQSKEKRAWRQS